jgi:hypothetical protein
LGERFTLAKKLPSALQLIPEAVAEVGRGSSSKELCFGQAEAAQIDLWNVDTVFAEVDGDILPEIGQL